jgi:hypothetical protein
MLSQYQDSVLDDWTEHCRVEKQNSSIRRFLLQRVLMAQIGGPPVEYVKEHGVYISA